MADVAVDSSGDIYVTGVTGATLTTDINNPFTEGDAFVAKFRGNNGNSLWSQMLASSGQDYARSIAVFGSDVYITGDTTGTLAGQTSFGDYDGFVARYTQNGNGTSSTQDWVKQFGTASLDQSQSITVDTNGFVYLTGETNASFNRGTYVGESDAFVAKYNNTGTLLTSNQLGTAQNDEAYGITVDSSGNVT